MKDNSVLNSNAEACLMNIFLRIPEIANLRECKDQEEIILQNIRNLVSKKLENVDTDFSSVFPENMLHIFQVNCEQVQIRMRYEDELQEPSTTYDTDNPDLAKTISMKTFTQFDMPNWNVDISDSFCTTNQYFFGTDWRAHRILNLPLLIFIRPNSSLIFDKIMNLDGSRRLKSHPETLDIGSHNLHPKCEKQETGYYLYAVVLKRDNRYWLQVKRNEWYMYVEDQVVVCGKDEFFKPGDYQLLLIYKTMDKDIQRKYDVKFINWNRAFMDAVIVTV
jgi:hypothetical protein